MAEMAWAKLRPVYDVSNSIRYVPCVTVSSVANLCHIINFFCVMQKIESSIATIF